MIGFALNPRVWIAAGVIAIGLYLVHWGDANGFNAQRVAAIERQLADTNARLKGYQQRDDQAAIDADVLRDEGYQRAKQELGATDKCIITPAMAEALNRIEQ